MATISGSNFPTLLDLAKSTDPDGSTADIVELLQQDNEILMDMAYMEANNGGSHRVTVRSALPAPTWRSINGFVQPTKGESAQIDFNCAMLEGISEIDVALVKINGDKAGFRLSQDRAIMESMNQEMAFKLFYGDEGSNPNEIHGLVTLYPTLNTANAANADNVIGNGGTSSATLNSAWLIGWGHNMVTGIVPKGSTAGIEHMDFGIQHIQDTSQTTSPGRQAAYVSHYFWRSGIAVEDWRFAVRVANIDVSTALTDANALTFVENLYKAKRRMPSRAKMGRMAWYMSRETVTRLQQSLSRRTSDSTLEYKDVGGVETEMFLGAPLRQTDALSGDESVVT